MQEAGGLPAPAPLPSIKAVPPGRSPGYLLDRERPIFSRGGWRELRTRVNSSAFGVQRATRGAIYLQDEIESHPSLTATLGLRFDAHSIYEEQWNPPIGTPLAVSLGNPASGLRGTFFPGADF